MTNDEKPCYDFMHVFRLWKRQRFSHKASTRLSERVIPSFHMICLPASFSDTLMGFLRKDELIRFPKITVALTTFVSVWDLIPQLTTGCFTAIPDDKGHDLTRPTAHNRPNPTFVPLLIDKWPHFIGFQNIFGLSRQKGVFKFRIGFVFFLSRKPVSVYWHQKYVGCRAYLSVHCMLPESALFAPQYILALVRGRHVCHNLCTSIAGYHWHCARFSQCSGFRKFDKCRLLVLRSCLYYTTYHFVFTTTHCFTAVILCDWLLSDNGQAMVEESGYVPIR